MNHQKTLTTLMVGVGFSLFTGSAYATPTDQNTKDAKDSAVKEKVEAGIEEMSDLKDQALLHTETAMFDLLDKRGLTISFAAGQATLNAMDQRSIKALVKSLDGEGDITRVMVVSWPDKEVPLRMDESLPDEDIRLAMERSSQVSKALNDAGLTSVDSYNMAENPGWLGQVFGSDDYDLKKSYRDNGTGDADEATARVAKLLREKGGASSTVILIEQDIRNAPITN